MILEGEAKFLGATKEAVWKQMNNIESLRKSTPGCNELILVEERIYKANIEMGVAAIKGKYDGKIVLSDMNEPHEMTLNIKAEGSSGIIEAIAKLTIEENDIGSVIVYSGEGKVSGLIAGVGQRMLTGIAKIMLGQFFKTMASEVKLASKQNAGGVSSSEEV